MAKVGKSAEDCVSPLLPGAPPPRAPSDLSPSERRNWARITATLPSDWITDSNSFLLKQLVRHVGHADWLAIDVSRCREDLAEARQRVASTTGEEPAGRKAQARERATLASLERLLHRLLRAVGSETDRAARLATKLKITQQAKYFRSDCRRFCDRDAYTQALGRLAGRSPPVE